MAITGNAVTVMDPYSERLASLPDVTRKKAQTDGTSPGMDAGTDTPGGIGQTLADVDTATRFRTVEMLVRSQDWLAKNRWQIDLHFDRIRRGVQFSRLEKVPNQSIWVAKLPNGMTKESTGATPNKADDLCNKVEDTLMADPPKLIAHPSASDQASQEAAELATRFLQLDGGETGTKDLETYRWALNNALTRASSFLHYVVDKTGGGSQPLQVLAHPLAQDPANPLVAMVPVPGARPDPMTGQPPMMEDVTSNPVRRYVSADNQFVDDPADADRVWVPKIRIERLRREQVRTFPATATADTAKAVVLVRWMMLADAMHEWPDTVGQMSPQELQGLAQWRPALSDLVVVPYAFRRLSDGQAGPDANSVGSLSPLLQRRMFSYRLYVAPSPEYPDGYWCDLSGWNGGTDLGSGTLAYEVTVPDKGRLTRHRDVPVVQVRPMQDVSDGDPMGWPFISRFAGASEAEATLWAAALDRLDNELHPHVFIRGTTAIDDDDWNDRTVPVLLGPQDQQPTYEQFPPFPPVLQLVERLDEKQDVASGLTETAQGLEASTAISGVAKNLTIQQAKVYLSQFQQDLLGAMTRGGRIKCQLAQAEFSVPQLMEFSGEAGSNEPEWWTGDDFAGVDRIGIQPGTGTMMTPEGRAQYVAYLQGQQWLQADEAADVALPGIRMDLGLPENPVDQAVDRSIAAWLKGPPEGWEQAYQTAQAQYQQQMMAYQQQNQMAQKQAAMGMAVQMPQPPQMPALPNPFPPRPNDNEPRVASATLKKLSRFMLEPEYQDMKQRHPAWATCVDNRYQQCAQALQPPPQIPKGVTIQAKADGTNLAQEEYAAATGMQKGMTANGGTPANPPSQMPMNGVPNRHTQGQRSALSPHGA